MYVLTIFVLVDLTLVTIGEFIGVLKTIFISGMFTENDDVACFNLVFYIHVLYTFDAVDNLLR